MNAHVIAKAARAMVTLLATTHPEAARLAGYDPFAALSRIDGLALEEDHRVRSGECPIAGTYDPDSATIRYCPSGSAERDHFTLLHELGHHLLAIDHEWSLDIGPALDKANIGTSVEERLVSTYAASILVPDSATRTLFAGGVTSAAVAELNRTTQASATACLVRALAEPGDRLVMLTNLAGTPWFAQTTGEPWTPGSRVRQPSIEAAAARALAGDGTHRLSTGHGLVYGSGSTNANVTFDVTVDGGLVFAVIEPTLHDPRLRDAPGEWHLDCVAGCGETFTPSESSGECVTCGEYKCSRCRQCECQQITYCKRCTLVLPIVRTNARLTLCEECE